MKASLIFVFATGLLLTSAAASAIKCDPADAAAIIKKSLAMFEAKPVDITKVISLKDGTVVTEEVMEQPSDSSDKVNFAKVAYQVTFEITRIYKGDLKVGHQFTLKWNDRYQPMCSHFETRMLSGEGVWAVAPHSEGEDEYKPYPQNAGTEIRKAFGATAPSDHGKTST